MYKYKPRGVCPREINIDLNGDLVNQVEFVGGCNGNLKAISKIVQGKTISEVEEMFEGVTCVNRSTSCVDQLIRGLIEAKSASGSV